MKIKGIDISGYQGLLSASNFKAMKEDGVGFVILKAGTRLAKSRELYTDSQFENN